MSTKRLIVIVACVIVAFFLGRKTVVLFKGVTVQGLVFKQEEVPDVPVDTTKYHYTDNPYYYSRLRMHKIFKGQYKVVMFGNSMMSYINWNELLNRNDIANRGIGGDVTEGLYNRLETVYSCNPELCFVECGINDIMTGISLADYAYYMSAIVDSLKEHHIKPVVMHILYVNSMYPKADSLNRIVDIYNKQLEEIGEIKTIDCFNLNNQLSENGTLKDEYVSFDKLHLNAAGYQVWGKEILAYL